MYTVPDQTGRRIVITGANSGTGKEAAKRLAGAGAHVIMAVRSLEKGEAAKAEILDAVPSGALEVRHIDTADLASVRRFAQELLDEGSALDVLINNAGVMAPPHRLTTVDGFELQFGTNFVGPFALTNLLLPRLLESPAPRVATMASFVANFGRIRFDDLSYAHSRYVPFVAYGQSKLADLLLGEHLATVATQRHWKLRSIIAHPGYTRTNLQTAGANLGRDVPKQPASRTVLPSQEVQQGAEPLLFAAADADAVNGGYYGPRSLGLVGPTKRVAIPRNARSADLAASLWAVGEQLSGTTLPAA